MKAKQITQGLFSYVGVLVKSIIHCMFKIQRE